MKRAEFLIDYIPLDGDRVLLHVAELDENQTLYVSYKTIIWEELK